MDRRAYHGVMAKTPYYRTNGTGRDTYIAYDNGGTFKPMSKLHSQNKILVRPKSAASKSSMRSLHYISDGTGRDSYIRISDGGLHASTTPQYFLTNFKASLRDYQPSKTYCDQYSWTQTSWKDSKSRAVSRDTQKKIQTCIDRLYRTKL